MQATDRGKDLRVAQCSTVLFVSCLFENRTPGEACRESVGGNCKPEGNGVASANGKTMKVPSPQQKSKVLHAVEPSRSYL